MHFPASPRKAAYVHICDEIRIKHLGAEATDSHVHTYMYAYTCVGIYSYSVYIVYIFKHTYRKPHVYACMYIYSVHVRPHGMAGNAGHK